MTATWQKQIGHPRPLVTRGDGYTVTRYVGGSCGFVRYSDDRNELTLPYDFVDETAERGRYLIFFRNGAIHIWIPSNLHWDSGEAMSAAEAALVLDRIGSVFGARHRITVNDRIHKKLEEQEQERVSRSSGC